ncbi:DNA repair protein [Pandoraea horticolens]|uniref:DNA repair protein RecN n=1 Tax=Pandoraea horticolens TaxID=2508298 RepID=A0A5E4TL79_9BURK|nr:DNA repair protein RecN [Pandoraea horticolens]VVD86889.1 DNA repair protein [Pandoraea horticolens]
MLRSLSIRDFVIVDRLDLEFSAGFTVFSGETGAGKSILIDALALAMGERGDTSMVRNGQTRADITAEFAADAEARPDLEAWLQAQALTLEEHGGVLLRRVLDSGGRSRAFINGTPATLAQLRELSEMLVDIHGQHAHQQLLRPDAQRRLLDSHAGATQLAADTTAAHKEWRRLVKRCEEARGRDRELQLERERLEWQTSELDKLNPQEGEWDDVSAEHRRLSHAASLINGVQGALDTLAEADGAIVPSLGHVVHQIRELAEIDAGLADTLAALEPAEIQLREAVHSLTHYAQRVDLDPERLAVVEQRLDALHSAARKFRVAPEQLPAEHAERRAQLEELTASQDTAAMQAAADAAHATYLKLAKELSKARAKAAASLSREVTRAMQDLSMPGGRFEVTLSPTPEPQSFGLETVEFLVAGHPGVPTRPLAKVASGGELARISLALQVIASSASLTPTLIFDEVDSGIGGAVAEVVGRLLRELGQGRQVLCVTHLPQVAALGHQHLRVTKRSDGDTTMSEIEPLGRTERVEEIARMLGGVEITATTRKHAREMLAL